MPPFAVTLAPIPFIDRVIVFLEFLRAENCSSMKRVVRWLKHLLAGRKEDHIGLQVNHAATDWSGGSGREKKRWSFAKQRRSGADGGARSWGQPAAATAAAESPQGRPKEDARAREEKAAVVIQKTFRGYLV